MSGATFRLLFWAIIGVMTVFMGMKLLDQGDPIGTGLTSFRQGDSAEASMRSFEKALAANPNDLKSLIGLGDLFFDAGRYPQAIELFLRAEKLSGPSVHIENDLGLLYLNTNRPLQAIPRFERALEIDPTHLVSLYYIGVYYRQLGDREEARQAYERVLVANPSADLARAVNEELAALRPDTLFK